MVAKRVYMVYHTQEKSWRYIGATSSNNAWEDYLDGLYSYRHENNNALCEAFKISHRYEWRIKGLSYFSAIWPTLKHAAIRKHNTYLNGLNATPNGKAKASKADIEQHIARQAVCHG